MVPTLSLRSQLLLLQVGIVIVVIGLVGIVAAALQAAAIREASKERLIGVAASVAQLPSVVDAYSDADPSATIQPIAELLREATGVTYVVVTDTEGRRFSHPVPARIGERVSTDPSVPLSGETFVGTEDGTLGRSWRVKVPVRDAGGAVIGSASVGILESELTADLLGAVPFLAGWLGAAALAGGVGAFLVSRHVWRRIHRQEPEQIADLLQARDAMLHAIGEGIVATDARGRVTLVNDEAKRLLSLTDDAVGRPATEVLDPTVTKILGSHRDTGELALSGERVLLAQATDGVVDGRTVGSILVVRDKTELHRVLRDLSGERDVTQALRAQAHEFSNRMHVISGLLELGLVEQAVDYIGRLDPGGTLLGHPALAGIADPEVSALLLAKTVVFAERGIEVAVDPDSDFAAGHPALAADVVTVLGNLLDNAAEAIGHDGRIEVLLAADPSGTVLIEVHDNGPGLGPDRGHQLWEVGHTTKAGADPAARRGFGLALVRRIADRRGGTATAGRSDAGGAAFAVVLPAAEPAAAGAVGAAGAAVAGRAAP